MEGMMLHCGAAEATFEELKRVQLPESHTRFQDRMDTYFTVPHHMLVGSVKALLKENLHPDVIVGEQFGLSTGQAYPGAKMFGLLKLDLTPREITEVVDAGVEAGVATVNGEEFGEARPGPNHAPDPELDEIAAADTTDDLPLGEYDPDEGQPGNADAVMEVMEVDAISPTMVFRNSYDRSMSISGGLGYNCFVCDNLALSGEIMFARKHTKKALGDVMTIFMQMIMTMSEQYAFDQEFREASKLHEMNQDQGFELLGRMAGNGLLPFVGGEESEFARAIKQWRKPDHECFEDRNLWSLFNAVTAAQARSKIGHRMETGSMASKVFRGVLGEIWVDKAAEISAKYSDAARIR